MALWQELFLQDPYLNMGNDDDPETHADRGDLLLYQQVVFRISDLNRTTIAIRFLYVSILAGYFTALSLTIGLSPVTSLFSSVEVYVLLLLVISVVVLFGVISLSFFDYIYQELIEAAARAGANIEVRLSESLFSSFLTLNAPKKRVELPRASQAHRMFWRKDSGLTSLRMSFVLPLLYLAPSFALLLMVAAFSSIIILEPSFDLHKQFAKRLCDQKDILSKATDFAYQLYVKGLAEGEKLHCIGKESYYIFSEGMKRTAIASLITSFGAFFYFALYSAWRYLARVFYAGDHNFATIALRRVLSWGLFIWVKIWSTLRRYYYGALMLKQDQGNNNEELERRAVEFTKYSLPTLVVSIYTAVIFTVFFLSVFDLSTGTFFGELVLKILQLHPPSKDIAL